MKNKKVKLVIGGTLLVFLLVLFFVINFSYGFIVREDAVDPLSHESTNSYIVKDDVVEFDFSTEQGPGQGAFSNPFLPGTWKMRVNIRYGNKIITQQIANCMKWGKGAGLPEGSIECDDVLYSATLENGKVFIYKSKYNFNNDKMENKVMIKSILLPGSIKALVYIK